jgi:hypothetical protein
MSVNDQSKKVTIYLDGKAVASQTYTKTLRTYGASAYQVSDSGVYGINGIVDDVLIFKSPIN